MATSYKNNPAFQNREALNHATALTFVGFIFAFAAGFVAYYLASELQSLRGAGASSSTTPSLPVVAFRKLRSVALCNVPLLPSAGYAAVVLMYLAFNLILLLTRLEPELPPMSNIASRAGWLAICNMVLVVFLALKKTPAAFLTAWSYERLNVLHRVVGYATVAFVIVHGSCYTAYFVGQGRTEMILKTQTIYGMTAAIAFLMLAITATVIRRWWYELFYYLHVSFWIVAVIMVGFHQPAVSDKIILATCVAAGVWVLDRIARLACLVFYSTNNTATLTPLPDGSTRVTLAKQPFGTTPAKHCFIWIPGVRLWETHPFTVVATNPCEFFVAAYDGFTRDLHQHALQHPGKTVRASVDGAYGTLPKPARYDKVVLVAGGSGASFTFGMAVQMLQTMRPGDRKQIDFIWVVRRRETLAAFSDHLRTLADHGQVTVRLFVTRSTLPPVEETIGPSELRLKETLSRKQTSSLTITNSASDQYDEEKTGDVVVYHKEAGDITLEAKTATSRGRPMDSKMEQAIASDWSPRSGSNEQSSSPGSACIADIPLESHRPDLQALIRGAVGVMQKHQRVLVMGCGPSSVTAAVRNATASCISNDGPGVELHCELFS